MNSRNRFMLCLVVLSMMALAGCSADSKAVSGGNSLAATSTPLAIPHAPIMVEVFEVKPQIKSEQLIPAVLSTEAKATVLAQRDGAIIDLRGQEGARVTKGEELARLNEDDVRTQLEQAELEVTRLSVEERQYEAAVKVNQSDLEQETALLKDGLTSKRQFDHMRYKLEGSAQELEKSRLATQTARSRVEATKVEIGKCIIRAPITGIITHRYATLGTGIIRNDKLFEVAQLTPLEVKFQLRQSDSAQFGPGHLVSLSLAGSDRIVAQARIRRLDPVAEALSNTRGYLADVIGGAGLIPGMAITVRLPRAKAAATLSVPRVAFPAAAELHLDTPHALFILDGNRAKSRVVWVNAVEGDQVEINSGLAAGDRVILAPPVELKAGDLVQVR